MNTCPTVSVLIPAYNAVGCVGRAIESALAQTVPPLEILVVDDGSADGTAERASAYPPPVRVVRQPNGGPAAARNRGAREARGEWLALLDADDAWLPRKLERQLPYTAEPRVGVVHAREPEPHVLPRATFEALWRGNFIMTSSALLRRAAFEEVGGFDEDRALVCVEDLNLWLRLAAAGWEIVLCPELLHHRALEPGRLCTQLERFTRAEFANLEKLARHLRLAPPLVEERRLYLCELYGREFLHTRMLRPARRLLGANLVARPSLPRAAWWLATFLPPLLLDLRRGARSR